MSATEGAAHAVLASVTEPDIPSNNFPICMVSVQDDGTGTAGTIKVIIQSDIVQAQRACSTGDFTSGDSLLFYQASAPIGYTKKSDWAANASVVVGNTFGNGGSDSPTSWTTAVSINNHSSHIHLGPSHNHLGPSHDHDLPIGWSGTYIGWDLSKATGGSFSSGNFLGPTAVAAENFTKFKSVSSGAGATSLAGTGSTGDDSPATSREHTVNQDTYTPIYQIMIVGIKD